MIKLKEKDVKKIENTDEEEERKNREKLRWKKKVKV